MTELLVKEISLYWTILSCFCSGIIGLVFGLLPYILLNKKDKKDIEMRLQKEANEIIEKIDIKAQEFKDVLCNFTKIEKISLDDFNNVTKFANSYFSQLKICCDNILSNTISIASAENTFLPLIQEVVEKKTIYKYYQIIIKKAKKEKIPYKGVFNKSHYKSIYLVYGKYIGKSIKNKIIVFLLEYIR